jgi:hypothetical protein
VTDAGRGELSSAYSVFIYETTSLRFLD